MVSKPPRVLQYVAKPHSSRDLGACPCTSRLLGLGDSVLVYLDASRTEPHAVSVFVPFERVNKARLPVSKPSVSAYPQQVFGHVALPVPKTSPPPLGLVFIFAPQDGDGIPFMEGQLIAVLGLVVPQSIHGAFVHHSQLLLYPWDQKGIQVLAEGGQRRSR